MDLYRCMNIRTLIVQLFFGFLTLFNLLLRIHFLVTLLVFFVSSIHDIDQLVYTWHNLVQKGCNLEVNSVFQLNHKHCLHF